MRPSNIIPVNCMNDFKHLEPGQAIKRPDQKGSFEIYLGQVYEPGAACCGGGRYEPVVLKKSKGMFTEHRLYQWDPTDRIELIEGEIFITGWCSVREVYPGDEDFEKYNQIWKEAISQ